MYFSSDPVQCCLGGSIGHGAYWILDQLASDGAAHAADRHKARVVAFLEEVVH